MCPYIYYQSYTLHGRIGKKFLPLVYALLPNKKKATYDEFFGVIKLMTPDCNPSQIMLDFEKGAISSLVAVYPTLPIKLCFFHFAQSLMRAVQNKFRWVFIRHNSVEIFKNGPKTKIVKSIVSITMQHQPSSQRSTGSCKKFQNFKWSIFLKPIKSESFTAVTCVPKLDFSHHAEILRTAKMAGSESILCI